MTPVVARPGTKRYLRLEPIDTAGYEKVEVVAHFYNNAGDSIPQQSVRLTRGISHADTNEGMCASGEEAKP